MTQTPHHLRRTLLSLLTAGALVAGAYQVKDNTGTLTVVSEGNSPPPEGSKLTVKGLFQSLVTLGSKSLAVLREESRETH